MPRSRTPAQPASAIASSPWCSTPPRPIPRPGGNCRWKRPAPPIRGKIISLVHQNHKIGRSKHRCKKQISKVNLSSAVNTLRMPDVRRRRSFSSPMWGGARPTAATSASATAPDNASAQPSIHPPNPARHMLIKAGLRIPNRNIPNRKIPNLDMLNRHIRNSRIRNREQPRRAASLMRPNRKPSNHLTINILSQITTHIPPPNPKSSRPDQACHWLSQCHPPPAARPMPIQCRRSHAPAG